MNFKAQMEAGKTVGSKDYNAIIELFEARLKADDKDLQALMMLATYYDKVGNSEAAIESATKALAILPTDFEMLVLAAGHWHEQKDHERAYHYVCRAVENPPKTGPGVAKLILPILRVVSVFKKYRNIEKRAREEMANHEHNARARLDWARGYKSWYEKHHVVKADTIH